MQIACLTKEDANQTSQMKCSASGARLFKYTERTARTRAHLCQPSFSVSAPLNKQPFY